MFKKENLKPTYWKYDNSRALQMGKGAVSFASGSLYLKWNNENTRFRLSFTSVPLSIWSPPQRVCR
jgi:hypothetical protein